MARSSPLSKKYAAAFQNEWSNGNTRLSISCSTVREGTVSFSGQRSFALRRNTTQTLLSCASTALRNVSFWKLLSQNRFSKSLIWPIHVYIVLMSQNFFELQFHSGTFHHSKSITIDPPKAFLKD